MTNISITKGIQRYAIEARESVNTLGVEVRQVDILNGAVIAQGIITTRALAVWDVTPEQIMNFLKEYVNRGYPLGKTMDMMNDMFSRQNDNQVEAEFNRLRKEVISGN